MNELSAEQKNLVAIVAKVYADQIYAPSNVTLADLYIFNSAVVALGLNCWNNERFH